MKNIPGFNLYKISEDGIIYSFKHNNPMTYSIKDGYYSCGINNNAGIRKNILVHRMVAITYLPNIDNKPEVNHIDGNKLNNNTSNLEWVTKKENGNHASETGLYKCGEENGNSRLILNTQTGIIYGSIKEAANSLGYFLKPHALSHKMRNTNSTPFIYA